jgi:tRNASer (uridine44-2'-O)-methyltransferase
MNEETNERSSRWLEYVLLKKFHSWMLNYRDDDESNRIESLSLIRNHEKYYNLYNKLKEKYGAKIENIWVDESTDAKKFVYEDLSIASYLITLWEQDKSACEKKFLDLGCGNGLLVYILTQEGYQGYGIDLRRRKLWDKYEPKIDLREQVFNPRENSSFEDVNFIIGNHTDELSPWIPVVSAKSLKHCQFFLLPCCAYEFSGAKFQRRGTNKSLYMSYIDYLLEISKICGYKNTLMDRLKIPSTKRIAIIGSQRTLDSNEFEKLSGQIECFVHEHYEKFIPRNKMEQVKNCTKIDKSLSERIVKMIFNKLQSERNYSPDYGEWNVGGKLSISSAAQMISNEDLKALKSECGGLQTLLRNKHQIFEVTNGYIKIRLPKKIGEAIISERSLRRGALKSSFCYFHLNHIQGCYFNESDCCYKH